MTKNELRYIGAMQEEMGDNIKLIIEVVSDIQRIVSNQPTRDEFNELKSDVKTIKAAHTDTNIQVRDHEQRITVLEAA